MNAALREARLVFDLDPFHATFDSQLTVADAVARKCKLWRGLCATHVTLDANVSSLMGQCAYDVAAVFEEAISNAVRHGKALNTWIQVCRDGNEIIVEVLDDGLGPAGGRANAGFGIYSSLTGGNFSLNELNESPGSQLVARLTIS